MPDEVLVNPTALAKTPTVEAPAAKAPQGGQPAGAPDEKIAPEAAPLTTLQAVPNWPKAGRAAPPTLPFDSPLAEQLPKWDLRPPQTLLVRKRTPKGLPGL